MNTEFRTYELFVLPKSMENLNDLTKYLKSRFPEGSFLKLCKITCIVPNGTYVDDVEIAVENYVSTHDGIYDWTVEGD